MAKKFTPEQTLQLVTLYRDHECLWDIHSEAYKNSLLRNRALQQMCADLNIKGFTVNDLKIKIKTIRSTYCIELDKIEKSAGTKVPYKPKVVWFDVLNSFLRDVTMKKKRIIEDGEFSDSVNDSIPLKLNYSEDGTFELDDNVDAKEDSSKGDEQDALVKFTYGILLGDAQDTPPEPKRKIYHIDSTTNRVKLIDENEEPDIKASTAPKLRRIAPKPATKITESYTIQSKDDTYHTKVHERKDSSVNVMQDEFDTFGKHVANQLRKLSTIKYIMAQEEIQSTITKFLMDDIIG